MRIAAQHPVRKDRNLEPPTALAPYFARELERGNVDWMIGRRREGQEKAELCGRRAFAHPRRTKSARRESECGAPANPLKSHFRTSALCGFERYRRYRP